jgi:AraC-like DNA-binding protein
VRPAIADFDGCLVRPVRRDVPALRLLANYVDAIRSTEALASPALRDVVVTHIYDLVVLALGAKPDAHALAENRGQRAARQAAILHAIEGRSGDPGLSASVLAAALGITPRYVHRLLEDTGKSFSHHLLEKRLERAAGLLRDPSRHNRRIGDIAGEAGFTDLSYFSRAFRRRFGVTPSDIREAARHG